jgi:hypothetical protein
MTRAMGIKRVKMVGVVVIAVMLAMAFARPMEASPQAPPTSSSTRS